MIAEISIGIVLGATLMAWLLKSTLRASMQRWEEEIKRKAVEEYILTQANKVHYENTMVMKKKL